MHTTASSTQHPPRPIDGGAANFDPAAITRPDRRLLDYYIIVALFTLIGFPFTFVPLYFRYRTLRYRFDDEGVWMQWGILFRREVNLTYRRIQDIHLTRNLLQRWMGLANVSIQTASGSATPEATIEGVLEAESLRDWLYTKMRGARGLDHPPLPAGSAQSPAAHAPGQPDEALTLLLEIRDALAAQSQPAQQEHRP